MKPRFVGMHKADVRASGCLLSPTKNGYEAEIFLKERISRVRGDGNPLTPILKTINEKLGRRSYKLAENSFLIRPEELEKKIQAKLPYFEFLKANNLQKFSRKFNKNIAWIPHHRCHARAATSIAPFEKSIVVVFDGAGSSWRDFPKSHPERRLFPVPKGMLRRTGLISESMTVYLHDGVQLKPVIKKWQHTPPASSEWVGSPGEGLGVLYESASKFIFNSILDSGKVMGLAPFGKPTTIRSRTRFIKSLPVSKAFKGSSKALWQKSPFMQTYKDVAATVQRHFEESLMSLVQTLKRDFPGYENLILTGGCALNCVANQKVLDAKLFKQIYVPPFPGDECISFGAAQEIFLAEYGKNWQPVPWNQQTSHYGPNSSTPSSKEIEKTFETFKLLRPPNITTFVAEKLAKGEIVGWYQGRSESGPRALGHRSILASPMIKGLKSHLNANVKGREGFRPYGGSCLKEKASTYFEVDANFQSPFMSFAPKIRQKYRNSLRSIMHIDGTSRIQTLTKSQDPIFFDLIRKFGDISGIYCLLNTSLNVMGEPIVETILDAKRFLEKTPVDALVVGPYYIRRSSLKSAKKRFLKSCL